MKIALILCPSWGIETPHLGIALLSANLRKHGYEVTVLDFNIRIHNLNKVKGLWKSEEEIHWKNKEFLRRFIENNNTLFDSFVEEILDTQAQVIGFSLYCTTEIISLELAKRIKTKDAGRIIICGGQKCFPDYSAETLICEPAIDAVVIGEGDSIIIELMDKISESGKLSSCPGTFCKNDGTVIKGEQSLPVEDINSLPHPDFSDFDLKLYGNPIQLPILSSRGCPYPCVFCNTKLFWVKYRSMSGERIFQEVKHQLDKYEDVCFFTFNDHSVNADIAALSRFADLMCELKTEPQNEKQNYKKFHWKAAAVIREDMDRDFMIKLRKSGCVELEYGIESASLRVRKLMKKSPYNIEILERVLRDTFEAGIRIRANFMFGFPGETDEDFKETLEFLKRNKEYFIEVHPSESFCYVDPHTYMYEHPEEFGIINFRESSLYWETSDGKNIYLERLRRHQVFCELAVSLKIRLSPGGSAILLHKQDYVDSYLCYIKHRNSIDKFNEKII